MLADTLYDVRHITKEVQLLSLWQERVGYFTVWRLPFPGNTKLSPHRSVIPGTIAYDSNNCNTHVGVPEELPIAQT
jgi:hypothetical protein